MRESILLWDYDDTLGGVSINGSAEMNVKAYEHVLKQFGRQMAEYGFPASEALALQNDIDTELAKKHGFADKTRFASSLVATYNHMAERYDVTKFHHEQRHLELLGMSVFEFPYVPLEGAIRVLEVLKPYYRQVVVTKGEEFEQRRKLRDSGVEQLVDDIFVLSHKSDEEWDDVVRTQLKIGRIRNPLCWAIGNSIKSDLNPPLRMGMNAIHINVDGWAFEHAEYETPARNRTLSVVNHVEEVLTVLPLPALLAGRN